MLDLMATDTSLKGFGGGVSDGTDGHGVPEYGGAYFRKVARFNLDTFGNVEVLDLTAAVCCLAPAMTSIQGCVSTHVGRREESPALGGLMATSEATRAELRAELAGVLRKTWCQGQALEAMGSRVNAEEAARLKLTEAVDADGAMGSEARAMVKTLTQDVESFRRLTPQLRPQLGPGQTLRRVAPGP